MTDDLLTKSALELKALMAAREVSPVEIVETSLRRLDAVEDDCNAFVTWPRNAHWKPRAAPSPPMAQAMRDRSLDCPSP